jgi:hypothetical protein
MTTKLHVARTARRETHSSRALASVLTAVALIAVLVWVGTEAVLSAAGQPALLVPAADMLPWLAGVADKTLPGVLSGAGAVIAVLGLLVLLAGLRPGRRPRHVLADDRSAVVIDDEVLAAAVSRTALQQAGLIPGQVTTVVGRRTVAVMIRPTSGIPVNAEAVAQAVRTELAGYGLSYTPKVAVKVSSEGAVGV